MEFLQVVLNVLELMWSKTSPHLEIAEVNMIIGQTRLFILSTHIWEAPQAGMCLQLCRKWKILFITDLAIKNYLHCQKYEPEQNIEQEPGYFSCS
jgi:hypothetical protein